MFRICLHNFPATLDHKRPGLCEHCPINSNIQHKPRQSPTRFPCPNTSAPPDAIPARQRRHTTNSVFPVEGKLRAQTQAVKASWVMLQELRGPGMRSSALAPMGRTGPGECWAGSGVSWAMVTPSGRCLSRGRAQPRGKHAANLPTLPLYRTGGDF